MYNRRSSSSLLLYLAIPIVIVFGLLSCSTSKNTSASRFYHNFTTRYNVFYNGEKAYNESYTQLIENHLEGYSEEIFLDPITAFSGQEKSKEGGAFDRSILKGRKAIQLHSIRSKPERKKGWQSDPKAVAFQNKREYNTFLHKAWMLVGKSQFYNADFLQAQATFSYIARLYSAEPVIRDEARLWQVRCYSEMGWLHEGQRLLDLVPADQPYTDRRGLYSKAVAERLILSGKKEEAIPYLQKAAKKEKNKRQRARMYYLLGQLLQDANRLEEAQKVYSKVLRTSPPFALDFAARIRRMELKSGKNPRSVITQLERMAKKHRYKDVLDQIYLAVGNIYMAIPDSAAAIKAFQSGVEKSTARGADFALCQIRLGDIYMQKRLYLLAQPCFSAAVGVLNKLNPDYERVSLLSSQLDELVGHAKVVHEQDSLLNLAAMPEEQRLAIIDSVIQAYIEEEKKQKEQEELEKLQQAQDAFNAESDALMDYPGKPKTQNQPTQQMPTSGDFYFYNQMLVSQGKIAFEKKWGKRILEDNWRRRRKEASFNTTVGDTIPADEEGLVGQDTLMTEEEKLAAAADSLTSDPHNREYYLSQLPMTEEAREASGKLIAEGLFGMGTVFNERMEKFDESIDSYETLLRRFPAYENRKDVLYRLYLLYTRIGKLSEAERCRALILQYYPEDKLAIALRNPNYLKELAEMDVIQNRLYDEAFDAYLAGRVSTVRKNRTECRERFPLSELAPKFDFLHVLCFVLDGDSKGFSASLKQLVDDYPNADVTELAASMLKELLRGRSIVQGGYTGLSWNYSWGQGSDSISPDSLPPFVKPRVFSRTRLVLLAPSGSLNKNKVLFALASFNFSRYTKQTLDIEPSSVGPFDQWLMSSLPSTRLGWKYIRDAYAENGFMPAMGDNSLLFPISEENYQLLIKGKSIGQYMDFLAEEEVPETAIVLDRWLEMTGQSKAAGKEEEEEEEVQSHLVPTASADTIVPDSQSLIGADTMMQVFPMNDSIQVTAPITFDIDREGILSTVQPDTVDREVADSTSAEEGSAVRPNRKKDVSVEEIQRLEKERIQNEKMEAKALEKSKREKEKERKQELKRREKERREARKAKLKEQREKRKERDRILKEKEKQRKEKLRQLEKERKAKEKERAAKRKA